MSPQDKIVIIGNAIANTHSLRARQLNALLPEIQRLERTEVLWKKAKKLYPDLFQQIQEADKAKEVKA